MLNWGLGYVIDLPAQLHQKFVEIHRRSINRLLRTRKRARAWTIFKVLCADRLEAYDAEVKRSLVRSDVVLFCYALY